MRRIAFVLSVAFSSTAACRGDTGSKLSVTHDAIVGANALVNSRVRCPNGNGISQNETSVAVGDGGRVVVVAYNDLRGFEGACPDDYAGIGWSYSLDSGATFVQGDALPSRAFVNGGDPWLGSSPDGQTFYLSSLWTDMPSNTRGIGFFRGLLAGDAIVWSDPTVLPGFDKEAFTVDPTTGNIYLAYEGNPGIMLTRSFDGGLTWLDPVPVGGNGNGASPIVDSRGNVFVAYLRQSSQRSIVVSRSVDGGSTFEQVANFPVIAPRIEFMDRSMPYPQMAADRSGGIYDGRVYVVFHSGASGETRPYVARSEDGGATWTTPIAMNTDDTAADHWWPSISVDASGTINAIFYDRRTNPGTGYTDVYLAQSIDGGDTFTNQALTDMTTSWNGIERDIGHTAIGDYIRIVSQGQRAYAAWTDPRNGDPDIYAAVVDGAP